VGAASCSSVATGPTRASVRKWPVHQPKLRPPADRTNLTNPRAPTTSTTRARLPKAARPPNPRRPTFPSPQTQPNPSPPNEQPQWAASFHERP
jgi:hypothetical protein